MSFVRRKRRTANVLDRRWRREHPVQAGFLALLALALLVILVQGIRIGILTYKLQAAVEAVQEKTQGLTDSGLTSDSISELRADLYHIHDLTGKLQRAIRPFHGLLTSMPWVPVIGDDMAAGVYALDSAHAMLTSLVYMDEGFSPLIKQMVSDGESDVDMLTMVSESIVSAQPSLEKAQAELIQAQLSYRLIGQQATLTPKLQRVVYLLGRGLQVLDGGITVGMAAPDLLGMDEPQHILVLIQNADELRPTGGFITSSAYVVIDHGKIADLTILNSMSPEIDREDVIYQASPDPMQPYMEVYRWLFRDANWSPDFPTTAAKASELYALGRNVPIDTVVAINQYTIQDLMTVTGPLTLADGRVVDADTVIPFFQESWIEYQQEEAATEIEDYRKAFIGELGPLFIDHFMQVSDPGSLYQYFAVSNRKAGLGRHRP
jgi:hypothetical protein